MATDTASSSNIENHNVLRYVNNSYKTAFLFFVVNFYFFT